MINIRNYQITDRYLLQKLITNYYEEKKEIPPTSEQILKTIGFFNSFSQCGSIYIFEFENQIIGYAIVLNLWVSKYNKLSLLIDEIFIIKNFRKYQFETNFIEYLIKLPNIYDIKIDLTSFKSISKNNLKKMKFIEYPKKIYRKLLSE